MYGNAHGKASLNDFSAYLLEEHGLQISKQSLDERFNEQAVKFLSGVLSAQLASGIVLDRFVGLEAHFNRVMIKDSTRWRLPDHYAERYKGYGGNSKSQAMISVQYEFDLLHQQTACIELTAGIKNDHKDCREHLGEATPGDLYLRDLGYISLDYLFDLQDRKAFFLNKCSPNHQLCSLEDQPIDFVALKKKMTKTGAQFYEQPVKVGSTTRKLTCRMVLVRLPEQVYQEKIRVKTQKTKSYGYSLSKQNRARSAFTIFITNVQSDQLTAQQVSELYRLRWQIELNFKAWKSIANIHYVKSMKIHRFECQLLARFIWLMAHWGAYACICHWAYRQSKTYCSLWKFYRQENINHHRIRACNRGENIAGNWLFILFSKANRQLKKEKRKHKIHYEDLFKLLIKPLT